MDPVLHTHLPQAPWMDARTRRLPGVQPLDPGNWLRVDEAYAGQMALRDGLIDRSPGLVMACRPEAVPAVEELRDLVLAEITGAEGYTVSGDQIRRPDGGGISRDLSPLALIGRLCQEDFCILQKSGDEHRLAAAVLCFPAGWTLADKMGRPLSAIHEPVAPYGSAMARRVQRMFDALHPDRPLWRANTLLYRDPTLFQPDKRDEAAPGAPQYLRSEFQCLRRLRETGAVVFSIHTAIVPLKRLSPAQLAGLEDMSSR